MRYNNTKINQNKVKLNVNFHRYMHYRNYIYVHKNLCIYNIKNKNWTEKCKYTCSQATCFIKIAISVKNYKKRYDKKVLLYCGVVVVILPQLVQTTVLGLRLILTFILWCKIIFSKRIFWKFSTTNSCKGIIRIIIKYLIHKWF